MYILGLHFGHDASVTVLKDGKLLVCLERERRIRLRHAIGLTIEDIYAALKTAGCTVEDIDYCSVTSTQNIEYIVRDATRLTFETDLQSGRLEPGHWALEISAADLEKRSYRRALDLAVRGTNHPYVRRLSPDLIAADPSNCIGAIEDFFMLPAWRQGRELGDIGHLIVDQPMSEVMAQSMQLPIRLSLDGRDIPGWSSFSGFWPGDASRMRHDDRGVNR